VEVTPSRGAVKNAASGLADAGVGTGNVGRKNNTTTALSKDKLKNAKKSSPSLSKNQQKMQSQTVRNTLSKNTIPENRKYSLSNVESRKWYLEQEKKIPDMINKNLSLEKQAKQAFNLRNQFRTQARELMADRELAESLYKTERNKTWKEIVQKQVDNGYVGDDIYKEIIASSQRSRTAVNKSLGLEGKK
jgi:hypothetical protein